MSFIVYKERLQTRRVREGDFSSIINDHICFSFIQHLIPINTQRKHSNISIGDTGGPTHLRALLKGTTGRSAPTSNPTTQEICLLGLQGKQTETLMTVCQCDTLIKYKKARAHNSVSRLALIRLWSFCFSSAPHKVEVRQSP